MGWNIHINESEFRIPEEKHAEALVAVWSMPQKRYRWGAEPHKARTLQEAFDDFGYGVVYARYDTDADEYQDGRGDIVDIEYSPEKLGDEFELFQALAPFVDAGSYIEFGGDSTFRYVFDGRTVEEVEPSW